MIIETKFTYYSKYVYIPDGYIRDVEKIHLKRFSNWMRKQPDCFKETPNGMYYFTFDADVFLRYLNTEVLKNADEKAYFVEQPNDKSKIDATLYF